MHGLESEKERQQILEIVQSTKILRRLSHTF